MQAILTCETAKIGSQIMNDQQLTEAIASVKKGANVYITWERPAKVRKAFTDMGLTKRVTMLLRLGVDYDKMQEVKTGREDGSRPATNQGMPGKEWIVFPFTKRSLKTGKTLLSVKKASFEGITQTTWRKNGHTIVLENFAHAMLASELKKGDLPPTFDLTAENVLCIHKYNIETVGEIANETETAETVETVETETETA
jgi:hypothetical protein